MPDIKENIKIIEELRKQRNAADEELYLAKLELYKLQRVIDKSGRNERTYPEDVSKEIAKIKKQISDLEAQLNEINRKLSELDSLSSKIAEKESYIRDYLADFKNKTILLKKLKATIETEFRRLLGVVM